MIYRQSIDGCLSSKIGEAGLSRERLAHWLALLAPRFSSLQEEAYKGSYSLFRILDETADIDEAQTAFEKLSQGADTVIVLGTGGSSLGGQTLAQLGGWSIPGDNGPNDKRRPRLRFYDNLDERSFLRGLSILNIPASRFIVISKSGTTAETLAQTLTAFRFIEDAGYGSLIPRMFLGVTEPEKAGIANGLRNLFSTRKIPVLPHPSSIGGRYSAFTVAGLLPAMARGLDPIAFRRGGAEVVNQLINAKSAEDNASARGAAIAIALAKDRGVGASVLMPYSDRLKRFAAWYVQLWAESLGKAGEGTTPIAALGPVDQHSQLQLFMDGPPHFITVVRIENGDGKSGLPIPREPASEAGAPYLADRTIGDLVQAQQNAIVEALISAKRPVRTIDITRLDECALGAMMMHFMIETVLAASLLKVDPFDQPAVELGKRLARQYLAG